MSLWKIAWRSIQQRALASSLTALSMALGVAMVVAVLVIKGVVSQSFEGSKSMGYHLVVGGKGGREQLVLSTVFLVSDPVEPLPYSFYKEFLPGGKHGSWVSKAVPICLGDFLGEYRVVGTTSAMLENFDDDANVVQFEFAEGRNFEHKNKVFEHNGEKLRGNGFFEAVLGSEVARTTGVRVGDDIHPRHGADEETSHEHDAFTVVGVLKRTGTPSDRAVYINIEGFFLIPDHQKPVDEHKELHDAYDNLIERHHAFLGKQRAKFGDKEKKEQQPPGDLERLIAAEKALLFAKLELPRDEEGIDDINHEIDMALDHVLLLQAQNSLAKAVEQWAAAKAGGNETNQYTALVEDHQKLLDKHRELVDQAAEDAVAEKTQEDADPHAGHDHSHGRPSWRKQRPAPENQREVTSVLLRMHNDMGARILHTEINEGPVAQAVYPVAVITQMFNIFVGPLHLILLGLTILIVIVSGVGILVSIYNSMSDRRHEIAVMRALGAGRSTVMWVVLAESIMLSLAGGLMGWILGHCLIWAASPWVEANTGVWVGPFQMAPDIAFGDTVIPMLSYELVLIPGLIVLATLVGFLPALSAYRTDVAKSLTANM